MTAPEIMIDITTQVLPTPDGPIVHQVIEGPRTRSESFTLVQENLVTFPYEEVCP